MTIRVLRSRRVTRRVLSGIVTVGLAWMIACTTLPRQAAAQSSREAIDNTLPKIVKLFGAGGLKNLAAYGTGIIISPEGHIATVWSHVLDTEQLSVVLNDGRRFRAEVLGAEPQLDLAVLKLDAENLQLPYFDLADAVAAEPGTRVFGFSNMFKVATGDEPVSVLHGVIAARTKLTARRGRFEIPYAGPIYVVDAITNNSGAAGGAVTTREGRLLAVIGKELRNSDSNTWINYAIPIGELREAIEQIKTGNYTRPPEPTEQEAKPRRYSALDFGIVMVPDVISRTPAYIDALVPGSAAAEAGLQPDDLVLFVNDELIQSTRMLATELGRLEADDTLKLIVRRGDKLVSVELTVPKKATEPEK
ncbi:MAG: trypsin-like peptidase domain-containing protein [Planctomycetaceae bacterium]